MATTAGLLALAAPAVVLAFPIRQALPDGTATTLEVDPALLPAFGLPASTPAPTPRDAPPTVWPTTPSATLVIAHLPSRSVDLGSALAPRPPHGAGEPGRWYVYAGTGHKTFGLTVASDRDAYGLDTLGRDRDGGTRAGLAWRKGDVQTSLGYLRGKVASGVPGVGSRSDDRVGLTLSWRPH